MKCLICGVQIDDHRDFCTPCYQKKIYEIEEEMSKKEGPSSAREGIGEAPVSEPSEEDASSNFLS